jgi:hypothetical protein
VGNYLLQGRLEFSVETTAYKTHYVQTRDLFPDVTDFYGHKNWTWDELVDSFEVFNPNKVTFRDCSRNFKKYQANLWSSLISNILTYLGVGLVIIVILCLLIKCCIPLTIDTCRERRAHGGGVPPRWQWRSGNSRARDFAYNMQQYRQNIHPYLLGRRPAGMGGNSSQGNPPDMPEREMDAAAGREMQQLTRGCVKVGEEETPPPYAANYLEGDAQQATYEQGHLVDVEVNPMTVEDVIRASRNKHVNKPAGQVGQKGQRSESDGEELGENSILLAGVPAGADLPRSFRLQEEVAAEVAQINREAGEKGRQLSLSKVQLEPDDVKARYVSTQRSAPPPPPPRAAEPGGAARAPREQPDARRVPDADMLKAQKDVAGHKWNTMEKRRWMGYAKLLARARDPAVCDPQN